MLAWATMIGALIGWALAGYGQLGLYLGGFVGVIAGWFLRRAVRAEVAAATAPLRAQLDRLRGEAPPPTAAFAPPPPPSPPIARDEPVARVGATHGPVFPPPAAASPVPIGPGRLEVAMARALAAARAWLFGGNTIVRVGLVILFVGLSFLASWAASAGLFPVEARLALVAAIGVALLVVGYRTRIARPAFGLTLQGGGIAAIYLTLFAAARLFATVPVSMALALMIVVSAFGCALALMQRSQALAVTAFVGGFAAPPLLPGAGGAPWALFGYYTVLNLAILGIASRRAWRALNLAGLAATFGLATLWGVSAYRLVDYPAAQGFLIANVLIYLAVAVLYTRASPGRLGRTVDTTLVFGPAIAGFGLQAGLVHDRPFATAFSALGFGALYLATAYLCARYRRSGFRVMNEIMLAIGIGFVTLAVPLALGARWTSAAWALEGAGAFWVGMRQARWLTRLFGLALQLVATGLFWDGLQPAVAAAPFAHPGFVGAVLIAFAWVATGWWLRRGALPHEDGPLGGRYAQVEAVLGPPAFLLGFAFWCVGWAIEAFRAVPPVIRGAIPTLVFSQATAVLLAMLAALLSAWGAQALARRLGWRVPAWPSLLGLAALAIGFLAEIAVAPILTSPGWAIWIVAIAVHTRMLYVNDGASPGGPVAGWLVRAGHVGGVWLATAMLADMLWFAVDRAALWNTSWAGLVFLASAIAILAGLAVWTRPARRGAAARWPLRGHVEDYGWFAAVPVALLVYFGAAAAALLASARTDPLPYVPLFNPVDLCVALALVALALWRGSVRAGTRSAGGVVLDGPVMPAALGALAFLLVSTAWLRAAHHLLGLAWEPPALLGDMVVETGLAILWTLVALGLMVVAGRRGARGVWLVGAALLGLTVVKLLLVDLHAAGGGARIVAFIGVGVLMLVVGYAAPLPPRTDAKDREALA